MRLARFIYRNPGDPPKKNVSWKGDLGDASGNLKTELSG